MNLNDDDDAIQTSCVVLGLDLEWNYLNKHGYAMSNTRTALLQLAYHSTNAIDNTISLKVALYHLHNLKNIPINLRIILEHTKTKFTGCQVTGDLARLKREFRLNLDQRSKGLNLSTMTLARGISLPSWSLGSVSQRQ